MPKLTAKVITLASLVLMAFTTALTTACTPALFVPNLIQSTQKVKRISVIHSPFLRGPLQGFTVNSEGMGALQWTQESTGNLTLQGRVIQDFKPQKALSSPLLGRYSPVFIHEKGRQDTLLGSFRNLTMEIIAFPEVGQLMRIPLSESHDPPEELGTYQFLTPAPSELGPPLLTQTFSRKPEKAYVMQTVQGQADTPFKMIKALPRGATFMAGSVDYQGEGLLLWRHEDKTYSQKITDFAPDGEARELSLSTADTPPFAMQMSAGKGFISFRVPTGLAIHTISDYQIAAQIISLDFNVNTSYQSDPRKFITTHSWDAQLSPEGLGWVAWISQNHQQAYYQQVKAFQFTGQPQSIPPNPSGMQFSMLRISGDLKNTPVIAGLDGRCSLSYATKGCVVDLGQFQEVWYAKLVP